MRGRFFVAVGVLSVALVLVAVISTTNGGFAATPTDALPADKAALASLQASFRAMYADRQVSADELAKATVIPQPEEPPLTGLLPQLDAPMSSSDFTAVGNAYLTVADGQWIRVWAGSGSDPTTGRVLVISVPMAGKVVDGLATETVDLLAAPISGGPLTITGVDDQGHVIITNPAGNKIPFNAVSHAFGS